MRSDKHGIVHAIAFCDKCNWSEGLDYRNISSVSKLRYEISKHIKETGHEVTLETGSSIRYFPD